MDGPCPRTATELDRLAAYLAFGLSRHPAQQAALLADVRRLRADAATRLTAPAPSAPR